MSLKEDIKHEASIEKEKISQMSCSDKLWYIGEYYKFHIIAIVVLLMLFGTVISTVYRNIYYHTALYGFVLNNRSEPELDTTPFSEGFSDYMEFTDRQQLVLESSYISYGDDATEFSYAVMAKLSALIAAKDLDFIIMDEESLEHYATTSAFWDPVEFLPDDILFAVENHIVYAEDESGTKRPCALTLAGTRFAADSNLAPTCQYFGIISKSTRSDTVLALICYIFDLDP